MINFDLIDLVEYFSWRFFAAVGMLWLLWLLFPVLLVWWECAAMDSRQRRKYGRGLPSEEDPQPSADGTSGEPPAEPTKTSAVEPRQTQLRRFAIDETGEPLPPVSRRRYFWLLPVTVAGCAAALAFAGWAEPVNMGKHGLYWVLTILCAPAALWLVVLGVKSLFPGRAPRASRDQLPDALPLDALPPESTDEPNTPVPHEPPRWSLWTRTIRRHNWGRYGLWK